MIKAIQLTRDILSFTTEVFELVSLVVQAVKQRDPDKAAAYARRAALREAFDFSQKAKRKEL